MTQQAVSVRTRNVLFIVLLLASMLSSALQTALNTALSPIMNELNITPSQAQWLTGAYSLVMGISVLVTPFLIRRIPAKPLFLIFFGIFTAGLAVSGTAEAFGVLLLGRILQAVGCGILMSLTQVIILTVFPADKRGSVMGIYGLSTCAIPVLAPTLAGIIIDLYGWRMIFFGSLAIGIIIWVAGLFLIRNVTPISPAKFDSLSLVLCGLGYVGIVYGLGNLGKNPFLSLAVLGAIAVGLVMLALFTWRQLTLKEPFLNLSVLKNREFRVSLEASMLLYAAMLAGSTLVPLYVQSYRGLSATVSGLITMPGSLITAVCTLIAGKLYDRFGVRILALTGTGALLAGNVGLCFLSDQTPAVFIAVMFAVRALGIGMLLMTLVTWGMRNVSPELTGDGTALITSLRTVAGAMGTALFVSLLTARADIDSIAGVNRSFLWISVMCGVLMLLAVFRIGQKQENSKKESKNTDKEAK